MLESTFILICQECCTVLVPNLAKYSHRFVGVPNALTKVVSIVELKCEISILKPKGNKKGRDLFEMPTKNDDFFTAAS